jgi:histidine ammonia-lyase
MTVLLEPDQLDLATYRRVVLDHEQVAVAPERLAAVEAARARMLADLEGGARAYGVNTGLGYLAGTRLDADEQTSFQRAILSRGAGHGPPFAADVVRGAMLLRLAGFLDGAAGVSADLCRCLVARLNDGWAPWVPTRGITSAGEVIPLTHLFQTLAGEGTVLEDGAREPAAAALDRRGAAPYEPGVKEGIALVNGAPLAPALAASLAARARTLIEHATLAGALAAALAGESLRPYARRIGLLKGDPGQAEVHARLAELHAGGADWGDRPQGPVSFRVLPQVHGAVLDLLGHLDAQLARELRGVTDSPLWLEAEGEEPAGFYPSGNFHSQALSLLLDALAIGATQVGNLSEKRLHRLLDRRFSHLPDQLATRPGRQTGLVFLHKSVIGFAAENRLHAAPASVHPVDTSAGQEDFQAFTFLAAEKLDRILGNLELILAAELVAIRQGHHLGERVLAPRLETAVEALAGRVAPVAEDRPLSDDVERVAELIRSGALTSGHPSTVARVDPGRRRS